jgi:hypothetical protein
MIKLFSICSLFLTIFVLSALVACAPLVPHETSPLGREKNNPIPGLGDRGGTTSTKGQAMPYSQVKSPGVN